MKLREFGTTALRVSELGLGCARIGGVFQSDSKAFINLLSGACDAGINFFDTADMYSQGESEKLIGRALRSRRDKIIIASKAGYALPAQRRLAAVLKPILRPAVQLLKIRRDRLPSMSRGTITQDFSPAYLQRAVEGSLRRLRTDYLDLFQLHSPSLEVIERGEWQPAVEELKRVGKIRYYGVAVDSVEAGLAALRYPEVSSIQFTLSLLEQRGARLFPLALENGAGGIAREVLANGLLVKSSAEVDLKKYCNSPEEEAKRVSQLDALRAEEAAGGPATLTRALEFPRSVAGVSVTLLGARNMAQLNKLLAAANTATGRP
jgi:aryl-alcohol dehydrogenase-like predicted oxidoreductase